MGGPWGWWGRNLENSNRGPQLTHSFPLLNPSSLSSGQLATREVRAAVNARSSPIHPYGPTTLLASCFPCLSPSSSSPVPTGPSPPTECYNSDLDAAFFHSLVPCGRPISLSLLAGSLVSAPPTARKEKL